MTRSSASSRKSPKGFDFDRRLRAYSVAATSAGVGLLALSYPCEAKIVFTKAHRAINPNTTIKLDLNHDGIPDFSVRDTFSTSFFSSFGRLSALPLGQKNQIVGHAVSRRAYASALFGGAHVGPKGQFLPGTGMMAALSFLGGERPPGSASCTGAWANVTNRYLGLKFVITGKVHFGWARLNVSCSSQGSTITALLTGYAYETVPNQPIVTGREKSKDISEGATLGQLATGAGLSPWRGKNRQ
jgi:hypothetical protein